MAPPVSILRKSLRNHASLEVDHRNFDAACTTDDHHQSHRSLLSDASWSSPTSVRCTISFAQDTKPPGIARRRQHRTLSELQEEFQAIMGYGNYDLDESYYNQRAAKASKTKDQPKQTASEEWTK